MTFDTLGEWVQIHRDAGLTEVEISSGSSEMTTPAGFPRDEGLANTLRVMDTAMTRATSLMRTARRLRRTRHAAPHLGDSALSGTKPA